MSKHHDEMFSESVECCFDGNRDDYIIAHHRAGLRVMRVVLANPKPWKDNRVRHAIRSVLISRRGKFPRHIFKDVHSKNL